LEPDYEFFQTPYSLFPAAWSVEHISLIARVCYVPYATCLFSGQVDETLHPASFYRFTHLEFLESVHVKRDFAGKFEHVDWYGDERVVISGHPKLDFAELAHDPVGEAWKSGTDENAKRILWTPRWNTGEGACHFFDYKDFFKELCEERREVDLVFRPHPLCFQNFLKTGELSEQELSKLEAVYEQSPNMAIDKRGEYLDTFLSSDVLVSDISSMLLEYFATGKPVVYTHRMDQFNELGRELSKGFYWVRNESELKSTLEMLLSGEDPLRQAREELMESILFVPEGGAGAQIKEALRRDYFAEKQ
jgi:hypothetical protein